MIIYGTQDCSTCIATKAELDDLGIAYEFKDLALTINLKEFLKHRDTLDIYAEVKELGAIGIPTFVLEDETITIELDEVKKFYGA